MPNTADLEKELKALRESFVRFTEAMLKFIGEKPDLDTHIQAGVATLSALPTKISFRKPFAVVPSVVATAVSGGTAQVIPVSVRAVDGNGFWIVPMPEHPNQLIVNWVAVLPN